MPTYFFHLRDGDDLLLDPEGRLLDGLGAIAALALDEARAPISAHARTGRSSSISGSRSRILAEKSYTG